MAATVNAETVTTTVVAMAVVIRTTTIISARERQPLQVRLRKQRQEQRPPLLLEVLLTIALNMLSITDRIHMPPMVDIRTMSHIINTTSRQLSKCNNRRSRMQISLKVLLHRHPQRARRLHHLPLLGLALLPLHLAEAITL